MRASVLLLPLLAAAAPVSAQVAPPPGLPVIPPAAGDRMASALDAVTDALLDVHVGRLKAAVEGHPPSRADRDLTLRDMADSKDPDFERNLHRKIAQARPMVRQGIAAVNSAVPEMLDGLEQVSRAFDRATANMPDPTYPRR